MGFWAEVLAFVVVGDARYGREKTPLDEMREKADKGLSLIDEEEE